MLPHIEACIEIKCPDMASCGKVFCEKTREKVTQKCAELRRDSP